MVFRETSIIAHYYELLIALGSDCFNTTCVRTYSFWFYDRIPINKCFTKQLQVSVSKYIHIKDSLTSAFSIITICKCVVPSLGPHGQ